MVAGIELGHRDDTKTVTAVVTGIFFVVFNLFVVYTLWRFRHRRNRAPPTSRRTTSG